MKKNYFKDLKKLLSSAVANITGIKVAAIIVTDKGIFKGVNYENSVLSLGICAERNAIFNAITNGLNKIYEIHVLSNAGKNHKLHMCGACREVASSFSSKETKVFIYSLNGGMISYKFFDSLPKSNKKFNEKISKLREV